jgi:hypothetical protein
MAKLAVLVWHIRHGAIVGTWVVAFPIAIVPLWQAEHGVTEGISA